jgi:hypothetical protein
MKTSDPPTASSSPRSISPAHIRLWIVSGSPQFFLRASLPSQLSDPVPIPHPLCIAVGQAFVQELSTLLGAVPFNRFCFG